MNDFLQGLLDAGFSPGATVTIGALLFFWRDLRTKVDQLIAENAKQDERITRLEKSSVP